MDRPQARALQRLGVDRRKLLLLGDLDPEPIEKRIIRDPFDQDAAVFTASYDRIDRCLRALADQLELSRAQTSPTPARSVTGKQGSA
jgi:protein-tyrosine-phosphatase